MDFKQFKLAVEDMAVDRQLEVQYDVWLGQYYFDIYLPEIRLAIDYAEDPHDHGDGYHRFVEREKSLQNQNIIYFYCESFEIAIRLQELNNLINQLSDKE